VETAAKSAFRHLDEGVYLLTLRLDYVDMFVNPHFKHHMLKGIAWEVRLRGPNTERASIYGLVLSIL